MARERSKRAAERDLDDLLDEITTDADDEDEKLWALLNWTSESVELPADGFVIGEPVEVLAIDYDGNDRRGLTARCLRDGNDYAVSWADVTFPTATEGALAAAVYRKWLGIKEAPHPPARHKSHKAKPENIVPGEKLELIVLRVSERAARCRIPNTAREISLRCSGLWILAPGQVATVEVAKSWSFSGHPYVSGKITDGRVDIGLLDLVPLELLRRGRWAPESNGDAREAFELEGVNEAMAFEIDDARELLLERHVGEAEDILKDVLSRDLRIIAAHELLGRASYDLTEPAIRNFELGVRIGELSLPKGFSGVLPPAFSGNRAFLACLHGYARCLWRKDRREEAAAELEKMLSLDPDDDLGARLVLDALVSGLTWKEYDDRADVDDVVF